MTALPRRLADGTLTEQLAHRLQSLLELTPKGVRTYSGGYTEYVTESGHEAPGVS